MKTGGKNRRVLATPDAAQAEVVRPGWRGHGWRVAALCALVAAAYSSSFQAGLVFDNSSVILRDVRIRAATAENLGRIFSETYSKASSGLYRPLTTLSYLFNYAVLGNGDQPAGYHWVNLAIHLANVLLVYLLARLVFETWAPALAMAALWGVHPLLTESVTNVVGRADLLAAFAVLVGWLCYARSGSASGRRKRFWLGGLVVAQAVGIFSKESAIVLPGLMLLYDLVWRRRGAWRSRAASYAILLLPSGTFLVLRARLPMHVAASNTDNPLLLADFWTGRLTAVKVIGKYLGLFVWPARLSPDYSYRAIPNFAWRAEDVAALAVCAAAMALAARWYRTQKAGFFGLAFFAVALLPVSNLVVPIGSIMAERFAYLPSIGLAACLVAALMALTRRLGARQAIGMRALWIVVALLCAAGAARTYARNFDWADERSLWSSAVGAVPESAKAHYNLGTVLSGVPGQESEAAAEFEAALRIHPDLTDARENLGRLLLHLPGRQADAAEQLQAALRRDPYNAPAHADLGSALAQQPGRLPEAMAQYQEALRLDPNFAEAHLNLGTLLLHSGRVAEAIAQLEAALRLNPNLVEAHNNLGIALAETPGRMKDAGAEFEAALRIDPANAQARANLERARAELRSR